MFNKNDTVLYGAEGVFKIEDIIEMDFQGEKKQYFVLNSMNKDKSTVYVPVDKENLMAKMRRILSRDEIYELIKLMPDEELIWYESESERMAKYKEILLKGDHREIVKLIKTLYLQKEAKKNEGKNLHKVDEKFLKDAEKILHEEFAYVLEINIDQVLPFIQKQIEL